MNTAIASLLNEKEILKAIQGQRWFAQRNSQIDSLVIDDWLLVPASSSGNRSQARLFWLKLCINETHCYSALLKETDDGMVDASSSNGFIEQLKLAADKGLRTHKGAWIRMSGPICNEIISSIQPFESGSSNTLQRCSGQHQEYVIKSYRLLDANNQNEVRILRALESQSLMPGVAGHIEYCHSAGRDMLGLVTEFLHAIPIHRLYSQSIRRLIGKLNSGHMGIADIKPDTHKLNKLSMEIGRHISRFHQQMNRHFSDQINASERHFDVQGFIQNTAIYYQRVLQAVIQDPLLHESSKRLVLKQLKDCASSLLYSEQLSKLASVPMSLAHGDLHMAHVFVAPDNPEYCRIIDPSPVSLETHDIKFATQVSLLDLVGLHRGLEYFSYDEIIDAAAHHLKMDAEKLADDLFQTPDLLERNCPQLSAMLLNWSPLVIAQLHHGYLGHLDADAHTFTLFRDLYRTFYFDRLLRELEYNYAYGREFFKRCDLHYLKLLSQGLTS